MHARVQTVQDDGTAIQLRLAWSPALRDEQRRRLQDDPAQQPLQDLRIVLARSAGAPQEQLPPPPVTVELLDQADEVSPETPTATVVRVSAASQAVLRAYVQTLEKALGMSGLFEPERVFHVGLTRGPEPGPSFTESPSRTLARRPTFR